MNFGGFSLRMIINHTIDARSAASWTRKYLKEVLSKNRCRKCCWTGLRTCSKCGGKGILLGGSSDSRCSAHYMEPCRRCIGTGKETCDACGGEIGLPAISSPSSLSPRPSATPSATKGKPSSRSR